MNVIKFMVHLVFVVKVLSVQILLVIISAIVQLVSLVILFVIVKILMNVIKSLVQVDNVEKMLFARIFWAISIVNAHKV